MKKSENKFGEFNSITTNAWNDWLKKDLKGKSTNDYYQKLGSEIEINPLWLEKSVITIPLFQKKANINWLINESISNKNVDKLNFEILEALEGGANSISIDITKNWLFETFEKVFKNINLNCIFINFHFRNSDINVLQFIEIFNAYLSKNIENSKEYPFAIYQNNTNTILEIFEKYPNIKFAITKGVKYSSISDQITESLLVAEQFLVNIDAKLIAEKFVKSWIFEIELNNSFYLNIAKIRSLKILWANILEAYQINYFIFIKCKINTSNITNENTAIVSATNQAISAVIAGADLIDIEAFHHQKSVYGDGFPRRIARNILNLLKIESHLNIVSDPMQGSYFIDNLTKKISEIIWQKFKDKIK